MPAPTWGLFFEIGAVTSDHTTTTATSPHSPFHSKQHAIVAIRAEQALEITNIKVASLGSSVHPWWNAQYLPIRATFVFDPSTHVHTTTEYQVGSHPKKLSHVSFSSPDVFDAAPLCIHSPERRSPVGRLGGSVCFLFFPETSTQATNTYLLADFWWWDTVGDTKREGKAV